MKLLEKIEEIKKEISNNQSNSFNIIKSNVANLIINWEKING